MHSSSSWLWLLRTSRFNFAADYCLFELRIFADFVAVFFLRISGSDGNIDHFPPSAACFNFSREEIFCHLVQSLLLAKSPIFNRLFSVPLKCISHNTVLHGSI